MNARNAYFIVLYTILFSHLVIAQSNDPAESIAETTDPTTTTTTTTTTSLPVTHTCNYPDEFPLFGDSSCISRSAYTGIFLASIILAGISLIMLIILTIILCKRRSRSSDSSYYGDSESCKSCSSYRSNNTVESPPVKRRVIPSDDPTQRHANQVYPSKTSPTIDTETPRSTSRAPYTDTKPVSKRVNQAEQSKNIKPNQSESYEMTSRQPNKPPNNTPQTKANQNGPGGKQRNNIVTSDDNLASSQF